MFVRKPSLPLSTTDRLGFRVYQCLQKDIVPLEPAGSLQRLETSSLFALQLNLDHYLPLHTGKFGEDSNYTLPTL